MTQSHSKLVDLLYLFKAVKGTACTAGKVGHEILATIVNA